MKDYSNKFLVILSLFAIGIVLWAGKLNQSPKFQTTEPISFSHPKTELSPIPNTSTSSEAIPVSANTPETTPAVEVKLSEYIEVMDSCGPYYNGGPCVNMRSGPGTEYPIAKQLRQGIVLRVIGKVVKEDHTWYKIGFDGWTRYPERLPGDLYVAADYVRLFEDVGPLQLPKNPMPSSDKRIVVDRKKATLYAYDGDVLFMEEKISVGLELTPTPQGTFKIYKKMPSRYMQGPLPGVSDQYYDLPGVPWDLYFTSDGGAIHGAYWHDKFGRPWSHGCVNMPLDKAQKLYYWAELGTPVKVVN